MFAIVETGGKQYNVHQGSVLRVEKIDAAEGDELVLDKVLAVGVDGELQIGTPYVSGAQVKAKVLRQGKGKNTCFQIQTQEELPPPQGSSSTVYRVDDTGDIPRAAG